MNYKKELLRVLLLHIGYPLLIISNRKTMWSKKFNKCLQCKTIAIKHKGHGLCRNCWIKDWTSKNPEKRKKHRRKEYLKNHDRYLKYGKVYSSEHKIEKKKYDKKHFRNKHFGGNYEDVLSRDNNQCQMCGSKKILIHHIDENRDNNEITNLITLCRECHPKIHYSKNKKEIQKRLYVNKKGIIAPL